MIDLHAHTTFSDGTLTPTELVAEARAKGLAAVALTDHNIVDGLPEFMEAGRKMGVRTVPGVEFSTEYRGVELHILALFVSPAAYAPITALLEDYRNRKERSNRELVEALSRAGMPLDYDKIRRESEGYVNRAVIGAAMTRRGYTVSVKDAFKRFLNPDRGYYIPPRRPDAYETVAFIKSLGAVAVLAHPFLDLDEAGLREFLPVARDKGLDGMEVYYARNTPEQTALSLAIAAEFGLLPSGGSDFHGENKPDISLGSGRGDLAVPDRLLPALEARKKLL